MNRLTAAGVVCMELMELTEERGYRAHRNQGEPDIQVSVSKSLLFLSSGTDRVSEPSKLLHTAIIIPMTSLNSNIRDRTSGQVAAGLK